MSVTQPEFEAEDKVFSLSPQSALFGESRSVLATRLAF